MSDKFKVVTDTGGLVNWGDWPKDRPAPSGLDEQTTLSDAKQRNEKAEALGIKTRYEVAPLS